MVSANIDAHRGEAAAAGTMRLEFAFPDNLEREVIQEVRGWEGVRLRPLFGWRGFLVGRRVFGCCRAGEEALLVWTKLPEPLWSAAMAAPLARPHPLQFQRWLELRAATPDEVEAVLVWLHHAFEWVRDGELEHVPPSF